ncbi:MAG TPA: C4-dicarboxylate ABC transporter permease, partial [Candidatus Binatia bacterium]
MLKIDFSYRSLIRFAVTVIAVAMCLYHMWVILTGQPEAIIFRGTHLLFALVLVFLIYGSRVNVQRPNPNAIDYTWLALGVASLLYLFINYEYVVTRIYYIDELTPADMIFGTILLVVVTEATRRCV